LRRHMELRKPWRRKSPRPEGGKPSFTAVPTDLRIPRKGGTEERSSCRSREKTNFHFAEAIGGGSNGKGGYIQKRPKTGRCQVSAGRKKKKGKGIFFLSDRKEGGPFQKRPAQKITWTHQPVREQEKRIASWYREDAPRRKQIKRVTSIP